VNRQSVRRFSRQSQVTAHNRHLAQQLETAWCRASRHRKAQRKALGMTYALPIRIVFLSQRSHPNA
jgi:hypothetical protein